MRSIGILFFALACGRTEAAPAPDPNVHTVVLPSDEPPLPDGPGKADVDMACHSCHSSRYLTSQPKLSRKAWTAEVDKMRAAYGAPIEDASAPKIVDYLVSANGTE